MAIEFNLLVLGRSNVQSTSLLDALEGLGARFIDDEAGLPEALQRDVGVIVMSARDVMAQRRLLNAGAAVVGVACDDTLINADAQSLTDGWLALDAPQELIEQELCVTLARYGARQKAAVLQSIEALGQFAGGAAHDFNNILTIQLGNLEILQMSALNEDDNSLVNDALAAAESGVDFTRRLGRFSNRTGDIRLLDLNTVVRKVGEGVSQDFGDRFKVRLKLSDQDIPLTASELRLEKVMLNLADNARDAMPMGGPIVIETRRGPLPQGSFGMGVNNFARTAEYAIVAISDEGEGMSPEVLDRATALFFSTRGLGSTKGIGLSIASAFLMAEGGILCIDSTPDKGTRVHCYLPISDHS